MSKLAETALQTGNGAQLPRIDKQLVHKRFEENVFIAHIEPSGSAPDEFIALLHIDPGHSFFFEHPQDHVPGLMLMEAGRQAGTAVSHLFYGVEPDAVFILNTVEVGFQRFAELDRPLLLKLNIADKQYRNGQLYRMTAHGEWRQEGQLLGTMKGSWSIYGRKLMARLRGMSEGH